MYDPATVLPAITYALNIGQAHPRKFVTSGCLSFVITCLSSSQRDTRVAAYDALALYSEVLVRMQEGAATPHNEFASGANAGTVQLLLSLLLWL